MENNHADTCCKKWRDNLFDRSSYMTSQLTGLCMTMSWQRSKILVPGQALLILMYEPGSYCERRTDGGADRGRI